MGGANQIPRKQEKIEHEYDHLVKVVKQTEGGQSKRDERVNFERNQKYRTYDKQEMDTTLQYQTQEYLIPIIQEPKRFQNRPNKGSFQGKLTNIIQGKFTIPILPCNWTVGGGGMYTYNIMVVVVTRLTLLQPILLVWVQVF